MKKHFVLLIGLVSLLAACTLNQADKPLKIEHTTSDSDDSISFVNDTTLLLHSHIPDCDCEAMSMMYQDMKTAMSLQDKIIDSLKIVIAIHEVSSGAVRIRGKRLTVHRDNNGVINQ